MPPAPFQVLGQHLQFIREQSKQSLAEVSGAVEIDEKSLARIEAGLERPSEDILLLLVTYFRMQNNEAVQLWQLAGYDSDLPEQLQSVEEGAVNPKNMVMFVALDIRTAYTDAVDIHINASGLTMNFSQIAGQERPLPVAKLGMSYEQANQVLEQLKRALLKAKYLQQPKLLPPSSNS